MNIILIITIIVSAFVAATNELNASLMNGVETFVFGVQTLSVLSENGVIGDPAATLDATQTTASSYPLDSDDSEDHPHGPTAIRRMIHPGR